MNKTNMKLLSVEVSNKLNSVVKILRETDPNIISIVLAGGFGKDEGFADIRLGKVKLLSDFDIFVFTNTKLNSKSIHDIYLNAKKAIRGITEELDIDVRYVEKNKLAGLLPILRFYDLKYASKLLYGGDVRKLIPAYKKEELPLYEGFRILMNRICFFSHWFDPRSLKRDEKLLLEIEKNYLICCSALNLLYNDHQPKLRDGLKKVVQNLKSHDIDFYEKNKVLIERMKYFIGVRLNSNVVRPANLSKEWYDSLEFFKETVGLYQKRFLETKDMNKFLSKSSKVYMNPYINYKFNKIGISLPSMFYVFGSRLVQVYRTVRWFTKLMKIKRLYLPVLTCFKDPVLRIYAAALFALLSIGGGDINKNNLIMAQRYLRSVYPYKERGNDLESKFNNFLKELSYAHKLILGMKPVETLRQNKITMVFRNIN